jgi:hypothetical protein
VVQEDRLKLFWQRILPGNSQTGLEPNGKPLLPLTFKFYTKKGDNNLFARKVVRWHGAQKFLVKKKPRNFLRGLTHLKLNPINQKTSLHIVAECSRKP